ncbi:hypothetical protein [Bacillus thermotolerans]|uniref:Uncharacterized protein n=1 Tax=Bacillus thermotolerans TaxID=1221996 RepID=A0A0F5HM84_BACTR|nr:hypothetical protein [Bacillus thermotolerans]KKB34499.1 hypothetical protein QY95_03850 [Bacillus thermotolerans]KKB41357.1 hypothetical protein QY96_02020 [Bacillus thermotolerans]
MIDGFWKEIKDYLSTKKYIQTLKGRAEAEVLNIDDTAVYLRIRKDNKTIKAEKKYFGKALSILSEHSRVRQRDILGGGAERYVLGILVGLPGFCGVRDTATGTYYVYKKQ